MNEKAKQQCYKCKHCDMTRSYWKCRVNLEQYSSHFSNVNGSPWYIRPNGFLTNDPYKPCSEVNEYGTCYDFDERETLEKDSVECPICGNKISLKQ